MSNVLILDWLTGDGKEHIFALTTNTSALDEMINNIETYFLKDFELGEDELRARCLQIGSSSWRSILHSIFFEAVIEWNAAHLSVDRPHRHLDESMYAGEMLEHYRRFSRLPTPPQAYNLRQKDFDEMKQDFADNERSFVSKEVDQILRNQR